MCPGQFFAYAKKYLNDIWDTLKNNICSFGWVFPTDCPTQAHFSFDDTCFEERICGLEGVINTALAQI